MKKKNTILRRMLPLGVILLLLNCQKEYSTFTETTQTHWNIQDVSQKEFQSKSNFQSLEIALKNSTNKMTHRNTHDSLYNFTIDDASIREVQVGAKVSYTFKINREGNTSNDFENLVIVTIADEVTGTYLIKYEPDTDILFNEHQSFNFSGNKSIVQLSNINISLNNHRNSPCAQVEVAWCSWSYPHVAGPDCFLPNDGRIFYQLETVCDYDFPNETPVGGGSIGGGSSTPSSGSDENTIPTVPLVDPRCTGGKVMNTEGVCVCPEGKIEDPDGNCICPEGYQSGNHGNCIKEGHCYELDKFMSGTSTNNPYIVDGSANDPTGENTHIRIAVINMQENLNNNWEHGYAFYNRGNFPAYGPYAHHFPAQEHNHVRFPPRAFQFGTMHTHPVNEEAIPMFSHDDLYSLLSIRNTYVNSGSALLNNNNLAGDNLFVNILVVKQDGENKVYAIKIKDIARLQSLESIFQNRRNRDDFKEKLAELYTNDANGINGSPTQYQKVFLQFVQKQNLGLDLYEMEQIDVGTPNVQERWHQLTLNTTGNGGPITKTPCANT